MAIKPAELAFLGTQGIILHPASIWAADARLALDAQIALDAQTATVFPQNAGVPWQMTNIIDPEMVRALVTPMKASIILGGETKKGDWTTLSAQFPVGESTGYTTSYGDFNRNGSIGANIGWVPRQSYAFQTVTQWGEREAALYGAAAVDYTSELGHARGLVHQKFMNLSYFFGVSTLQNYGLLNDPSLSAALTPATKAVGGATWVSATPTEVLADIQALYSKLQVQLGGNLDLASPMILAMSPATEVYLLNTNSFGISVADIIKKNFPNLKVETAPEYATVGGNLIQLIAQTIDGIRTGYAAFTEKDRAHALIPDLSSWAQKHSGGTWGAIIRRPLAIAQSLGV